jgi:hypothetical protein
MLFRKAFFRGGSGFSQFRPLRASCYVASVCVVFLAVWTFTRILPGHLGTVVQLLAWLLIAGLLCEIVLVVLGLQGVVGPKLAMNRENFILPSLFDGQRNARSVLLVTLSLIASLYCAGAALLLPFTAITFNGDGCAEWTTPTYRFLLLAVNMTPGYEACIAEPPLLYRSARFVINVMIAGTFIANLPDLIGKAGR